MFASQNRIRIGEVFGHEIAIDPIALGIFALYAFSLDDKRVGAAFFVAAFISILVHELGHAVAIRKLLHQHTVVIIGLGGVTLSRGPRSAGKQLLISVAGPAAGFVLGLAGWAASVAILPSHAGWPPWAFHAPPPVSIWLTTLYFVILLSLVWGAVNLLPIYPLDGGQSLRAVLELAGVESNLAGRITRRIAIGAAIGFGAWFIAEKMDVMLIFLAIWVLMANLSESRRYGF